MATVRWSVNTSPDIVEDACAFAWAQFMRYQPSRRRNWRAWLITSAEREAWRLHRAEVEAASSTMDDGTVLEPPDPRDRYTSHLDVREALSVSAQVPDRRRQVKTLHVLGFKYEEISEMLGIGYTRVNALLVEAAVAIRKERLGR